jgi:hypothetical protein
VGDTEKQESAYKWWLTKVIIPLHEHPAPPIRRGKKGSIIMEPARIHYFLAIATDKKVQIDQLLEQIEKRRNRGRALILLQQCLERGELLVEDVGRILEEHGEEPLEIFRLVETLTFADATEVNAVAKADIGAD